MRFGTKHKTVTDKNLIKVSADSISNDNLKRVRQRIINRLPNMLISQHARGRYEKRELFFNKATYKEIRQGNFRIVEITVTKDKRDWRVLIELNKIYEINHGQKVFIYYVISLKNLALVTGYINKINIGRKNTKKYNKSVDKMIRQVYYNSIKKRNKGDKNYEKSRMVYW